MEVYSTIALLVALLSGFPFTGATSTPNKELIFEIRSEEDLDISRAISRNLSDVHYLLWTRSNVNDDDFYELEAFDPVSLEASPFDGLRRTYFIIHGYTGNGMNGYLMDIKDNVLAIEDANVISVDHELLVGSINYPAAVQNMYAVANFTALYIDWLVEVSDLSTSNIHIIGHSLGGQCAGMIGHYVTSGLIDRITGLDPAGPLFHNKTNEERLDKEDASFVDIIHTNGCTLPDGCYGLKDATGHVDFYPNGGDHQAGCLEAIDISGCSHSRSHAYFIESFGAHQSNGTELTFVSWPCQDYDTFSDGGCPDCGQGCLEMGFYVDRSLEGSYYLITKERSPFANGNSQN